MQHIGFALVGLGFCIFLSVSAVAGIVADYKKRYLELEPLRAAIERGQQLDPSVLQLLRVLNAISASLRRIDYVATRRPE
jgi:hypothetical protein